MIDDEVDSPRLTWYCAQETIAQTELAIVSAILDGWQILVPPTPRLIRSTIDQRTVYIANGYWFLMHKFRNPPPSNPI